MTPQTKKIVISWGMLVLAAILNATPVTLPQELRINFFFAAIPLILAFTAGSMQNIGDTDQ